jgi:hypothetical protein
VINNNRKADPVPPGPAPRNYVGFLSHTESSSRSQHCATQKLCGEGYCRWYVTENNKCDAHQPGWEWRQFSRLAEDILSGRRSPLYGVTA